MTEQENRSIPVLDWRETDSHMAAYRLNQEQQGIARQAREDSLFMTIGPDTGPPAGHPDEYLEAASERFRAEPEHGAFVGAFEPQREAAARDFNERKEQAQTMVSLLEAAGKPVPEKTRAQAEAVSKQEWVDSIKSQRVRTRRAAQRSVGARWT